MFLEKDKIEALIQNNRRMRQQEPLQAEELACEVEDVARHATFVNEIGRFILWNALKTGQISLAQFKVRAFTNQPKG